MEVVGVIASSITLLEASLKAIDFFQEMSTLQDDFRSLQDVMTDIDTIAQDFRAIPPLFAAGSGLPQVAEPALITRALLQMERIKVELDEITTYCKRNSDNGGDSKAKKRKWILKRNRIPMILERARDARSNFQTGIQLQTMALGAMCITREKPPCEKMLVIQELHKVQRAAYGSEEPHHGVVLGEVEAEEGEAENSRASNDSSDPETVVSINDIDMLSSGGSYSLRRPGMEVAVPAQEPGHSDTPRLFASGATGSRLCNCRKQWHRNRYRGPLWLQPMVGSWLLESSISYGPEGPLSSNSSCGCGTGFSLNMESYPPMWLSLLLKVAYKGSCLSLTLRPAKAIYYTDFVYGWAFSGAGPEFCWMEDWIYFPEDSLIDGRGLMELAIIRRQYSVVDFLLKKWENLLQHRKFRQEVAFSVYWILVDMGSLREEDVELMKRILSFVEDAPGWGEKTLVHVAVRQGQGVKQALEKEPWALEERDYLGQSPIQTASIEGNKRALEELIQANASVNVVDFRGVTPLMKAALNGHIDCVRLLLEHGCSVNQRDKQGQTALHYAAESCDPEVVASLLAAGASVSIRDADGQSPLRRLGARSENHENVEQTLRLLLASGKINCDVKCAENVSPLMLAISAKRLTALRCLVDAGASIQVLDEDNYNILHFVGTFAHLEMLEYFLSLDPEFFLGINANQRNRWSRAPWDYFIDTLRRYDLDYREEPSHEACGSAFDRLLRRVHDTNIKYEIMVLQSTLRHLREHRIGEARSQLDLVIIQRGKWKEDDVVGYFRGIDQQIQDGDFEAAIAALEEDIDDLHSQIGTSPWRIMNPNDPTLAILKGTGAGDNTEAEDEDDDDVYETAESEDGVESENTRTA